MDELEFMSSRNSDSSYGGGHPAPAAPAQAVDASSSVYAEDIPF